MKTEFKLPNGKITTSFSRYSKEWVKLGKFIEKITNNEFYLAAFDPTLQFNSKFSSWPLDLPPSFVIRLKEKYDSK